MKNIFILLFVIVAGCRNNNPSSVKNDQPVSETVVVINKGSVDSAAKKQTQTDTLTKVKSKDTHRLVVLFYSIGSGVETEAINAYEDSIGAYSLEIGKSIDYKRKSWGREGETDVVFTLNELTPVQQQEFVARTKRILSKAKW